MFVYLVTASDYDYALIDSVWLSREEAEARIEQARRLAKTDRNDLTCIHSYAFRVKPVAVGSVLDEVERFGL